MMINSENERIKKMYLDRLKEPGGFSDDSINSISGALLKYDQYSNSEDYGLMSPAKAVAFKKWLSEQQVRGRPISLTSNYHTLRHVRGFVKWLTGEPGFKIQNLRDSIDYLNLDQNQIREATAPKYAESPSLEHTKQLVASIDQSGEIGKRDAALIAYLLLTGMRDLAVASFPIVCFDRTTLLIKQDPAKGVKTKRRKTIYSQLLQFDESLVRVVLNWYDYLVNEKQFKPTDPLFPQTDIRQSVGGYSFESRGVKPEFWQTASPIRKIILDRSREANLPYFKPHLFRRAAIRLATPFAKNAEQIRALSQNFGHDNIGTTLMTYGMLDTHQVIEIVGKMDFGAVPKGKVDKAQIASMIAYLQSLNDE